MDTLDRTHEFTSLALRLGVHDLFEMLISFANIFFYLIIII